MRVTSKLAYFGFFSFLLYPARPSLAAEPDSWRGISLHNSTVDDVIRVMGPAKKDESTQLRLNRQHFIFIKYLSGDARSQQCRLLRYEKLDGFSCAAFVFWKDRLLTIYLEPDQKSNKIEAKDLPKFYPAARFPATWEAGDLFYVLAGSAPHRQSVVLAGIILSAPEIMRYEKGKWNGFYPGEVRSITLASESVLLMKDIEQRRSRSGQSLQ